MSSNSSEYTPQQYKKYNGQSVFKALGAIGNEASADELANFIARDIGEREEIILPEIKQVLRRGIANGFLVRNGRLYSIVGDEPNMQVDSKQRRGKHSSIRNNRAPKRGVFSRWIAKRFEKEQQEEGSDEEGTEEEEEGSEDDENDEEEDLEEMQTDGSARYRPKVKLYEIYNPPESESEDEESEQDYDDEPTQKRIRLHPNF